MEYYFHGTLLLLLVIIVLYCPAATVLLGCYLWKRNHPQPQLPYVLTSLKDVRFLNEPIRPSAVDILFLIIGELFGGTDRLYFFAPPQCPPSVHILTTVVVARMGCLTKILGSTWDEEDFQMLRSSLFWSEKILPSRKGSSSVSPISKLIKYVRTYF